MSILYGTIAFAVTYVLVRWLLRRKPKPRQNTPRPRYDTERGMRQSPPPDRMRRHEDRTLTDHEIDIEMIRRRGLYDLDAARLESRGFGEAQSSSPQLPSDSTPRHGANHHQDRGGFGGEHFHQGGSFGGGSLHEGGSFGSDSSGGYTDSGGSSGGDSGGGGSD